MRFGTNPWNLSERQERILEALAEHGTDKKTAQALGVSCKDIEYHTQRVRKLMGGVDRLCAVVMYDRWKRGRDSEVASRIVKAVRDAMEPCA
jgi:DNA-binding NarL/FixJ family response regulator